MGPKKAHPTHLWEFAMSRWLIMAGGTGGHIFPALAVARELQRRGHEVVWLGSNDSMEAERIPKEGIPIELLPMKGVRRNGIARKLKMPFMVLKSASMAVDILKQRQIDGVIGFGGFITVPGVIAGKLLNKAVVIHEQNAIAGMANVLGRYFSGKVFTAFPKVFRNGEVVGNPVREDILKLKDPRTRFASHQGPLSLLVVGGSLGAKYLNDNVPLLFSKIAKEKRPFVVHQTGKNNSQAVKERYVELLKGEFQSAEELEDYLSKRVRITEFIEDMASCYASADYVICRSGALTVAELAVAGLGGYLVPYPFAVDDHQSANGRVLEQVGAAKVVQQKDADIDSWAKDMENLSREDCARMGAAAREMGISDSAKRIVQGALELLEKNKK